MHTVHCHVQTYRYQKADSHTHTHLTAVTKIRDKTNTTCCKSYSSLSSSFLTHSLYRTPSSLHPLPLISPIHLFLLLSQQGKEGFLQILHRYMEVHGTVYYETQRPPEVPAFVKNHGLLPQNELQQLLRKAKARHWKNIMYSHLYLLNSHCWCTQTLHL